MRARRRTHHSHVAWSRSDEEFQSQTPRPAWDAAWDRVRAERKQAGLPNAYVPKPPSAQLPPSLALSPFWRYLYQPLHGVEPSIFPLEIRLGLEAGRATPALAEAPVGQAAVTPSQNSVLEYRNVIME